jgi:hypothetical protein
VATEERTRIAILTDLIELRKPVSETVETASALPWDRSYDLVAFTADHAKVAVAQFLADEVSSEELEAWAELVHGREDLAIDANHRELIVQFLVELSTPELFGALTKGSAKAWLDRLSGTTAEDGPADA